MPANQWLHVYQPVMIDDRRLGNPVVPEV